MSFAKRAKIAAPASQAVSHTARYHKSTSKVTFDNPTPFDANCIWLDEIRALMFARGDATEPLIDAARTMHQFVERQMYCIIKEAQGLARKQPVGQNQSLHPTLQPHHVLATIANHPNLIKRLAIYFRDKDNAQSHHRYASAGLSLDSIGQDDQSGSLQDDKSDKGDNSIETRRVRSLRQALQLIDPIAGALTSLVDEMDYEPDRPEYDHDVVRERRKRRYVQAERLFKDDDYNDGRFRNARQVFFLPRRHSYPHAMKFYDWLFEVPSSPCNVGPKPEIPSLCLEILAYLTSEIHYSLMDAAILVRDTGRYSNTHTNSLGLDYDRIASWEQQQAFRRKMAQGQIETTFYELDDFPDDLETVPQNRRTPYILDSNKGRYQNQRPLTSHQIREAYRRLTFNSRIIKGRRPEAFDCLL